MFEKLLQKRVIRDFLQKYSEDQWSGVIRAVFEIGVLTLQNSFGTLNYSKKDFDNIINNLKSKENKSTKEEIAINQLSNPLLSPKQYAFKKPSKDWRYCEPFEYNEDKIKELRYNYHSDTQSNSDDDRYTKINNKRKKNNDEKAFDTSINKSRSNSFHQRKIFHIDKNEIREKNRETSLHLQTIESKIKEQVRNDKKIYQQQKNKTKTNINSNKDDESEKESNDTKMINNNTQSNNNVSNVNFIINYDKQLHFQEIQKKSKPKTKNTFQKFNKEINEGSNNDKPLKTKKPIRIQINSNQPKIKSEHSGKHIQNHQNTKPININTFIQEKQYSVKDQNNPENINQSHSKNTIDTYSSLPINTQSDYKSSLNYDYDFDYTANNNKAKIKDYYDYHNQLETNIYNTTKPQWTNKKINNNKRDHYSTQSNNEKPIDNITTQKSEDLKYQINNSKRENDGQLSMLKISNRTRNLFQSINQSRSFRYNTDNNTNINMK